MPAVNVNPQIEASWKKALAGEFKKPYFSSIKSFLLEEKQKNKTIFPPGKLIFNAFEHCPFDKVKVVIIGQDPYHGPGQAHGLCFSVPIGIKPPPSLINIYKELQQDVGVTPPSHGNLEKWARQGILLLNSSLTVQAHQAFSHSKIGWQTFTDSVIKKINDEKKGIIFILWGRPAQEKGKFIDTFAHHVLKSVHPSPLSAHRGFFGCRHFSKTNELLVQMGKSPIDWQIE
ncbi:MAG: uracil-DNA glycosylase [Fibrobacteria bacterium]|nr:uracil-DNA glycosylase [Fibrobacteria bacterium]